MKRAIDKDKMVTLLNNEVSKFQSLADKHKKRGNAEAAVSMELSKYRMMDLVMAVEMGILDETVWSDDDE